MPDDVHRTLVERGLVRAFEARPPYQRNDYMGWIIRARRDNTRQRRIDQMIDELTEGDVYMGMAWLSNRANWRPDRLS